MNSKHSYRFLSLVAYRSLPHRHLYGIMALVFLHFEIAHFVVIYVVMQRPNCEFRKLERLS
jgi:hypothetical protein